MSRRDKEEIGGVEKESGEDRRGEEKRGEECLPLAEQVCVCLAEWWL